jgi:mRNA interferase MazF
MSKDYDSWNKRKKNIDKHNENKFYHAREVWWCILGLNIGFEQDGTGDDFERPVLILKGFSRNVCTVISLTTSTKKNPYHISAGKIDEKEAFAIISQIRLIDTKRFINKICTLDQEKFEIIRKAAKDIL